MFSVLYFGRLFCMVVLTILLRECGAVNATVELQDVHGSFPAFPRQNELPPQNFSEKHHSRNFGKLSPVAGIHHLESISDSRRHHPHQFDARSNAYSPLLPLLFQPSLSQEAIPSTSTNEIFEFNKTLKISKERSTTRPKIAYSSKISNKPNKTVRAWRKPNEANEKLIHNSKSPHIKLEAGYKSRLPSKPIIPTTFSTQATPTDDDNEHHKNTFYPSSKNTHETASTLSKSKTFKRVRKSPRRERNGLYLINEDVPAMLEITEDSQRAYDPRDSELGNIYDNIESPGSNLYSRNINTKKEQEKLEIIPEIHTLLRDLQYHNPLGESPLNDIYGADLETMKINRLSQLYGIKKRSFDPINDGILSGINQNRYQQFQPKLNNNRRSRLQKNHNWNKRNFDAIGSGYFLGLSQNHIDKRKFPYTSNAKLQKQRQDRFTKRNFDPIDGGILSGLKQNHLGKRYIKFTPISSSFGDKLSWRNTHVDSAKRTPEGSETIPNILQNRNFVSSDDQDDVSNMDSKIVYPERAEGIFDDTRTNRKGASVFDSDPIGPFPNHIGASKIGPKEDVRFKGGLGTLFLEKRLDAISNGALIGIRQNFLDKMYYNSFLTQALVGYRKHFTPHKSLNSFGTNLLQTVRGNMIHNLNFNPQNIKFDLGKDEARKRSFPVRSYNRVKGLEHSFPGKRSFDSISVNSMNQFDQNFVSRPKIDNRRTFDPFSENYLIELSQNFPGNVNNKQFPINRLNEVGGRWFKKHWFPFGKMISLNGPRSSKLFSLNEFQENAGRHFPTKRSQEVSELDHLLDDLAESYDKNSWKIKVDSQSRPEYLKWASPNELLQTDRGLGDYTFPAGQGDDHAVKSDDGFINYNDQDGGGIAGIADEESFKKKSFDAINSYGSLSGIDQNFVESASAKSARLGNSPRRATPKRTFEIEESSLKGREDEDRTSFDDPSLFLGDSGSVNGGKDHFFKNDDNHINTWTPGSNRQFFPSNVDEGTGNSKLYNEETYYRNGGNYGTGFDNPVTLRNYAGSEATEKQAGNSKAR